MAMDDRSARENMLVIAAMSGGEIVKDVCRDICGSKAYYQKMTAKMNGELVTVYGNEPRTMHITRKGCERIAKQVPWVMDALDSRKLVYQKAKSARHAAISRVVFDMMVSGVPCVPSERGTLDAEQGMLLPRSLAGYFCPCEIKPIGGDSLSRSKICGALFAPGYVFLIYNMEDRNIRYNKKNAATTEAVFKACSPGRNVRKLMYGNGYGMIDVIMENGERIKKFGSYNPREENCVTPGTQAWYIPNGREGAVCLKALFRQDDMQKLIKGLTDRLGTEVVSTIPFYIPSCARLSDGNDGAAVLCLKSQKEFIGNLTGGRRPVRTVDDGDLEEMFDREGYPWERQSP